jgi:hypothetical protein
MVAAIDALMLVVFTRLPWRMPATARPAKAPGNSACAKRLILSCARPDGSLRARGTPTAQARLSWRRSRAVESISARISRSYDADHLEPFHNSVESGTASRHAAVRVRSRHRMRLGWTQRVRWERALGCGWQKDRWEVEYRHRATVRWLLSCPLLRFVGICPSCCKGESGQ